MFRKTITSLILMVLAVDSVYAAIGCTLNDPDRDVKRLFPNATNYKTEFITIQERGGRPLLEEVELKLGDKFGTKYETIDVPYTYYTVLHGKSVIGYVHGVNQKGTYGGMQLILATNLKGVIKDFYYQKLTSPAGKSFRAKSFTQQFVGLSLKDFYQGKKLQKLNPPGERGVKDYMLSLRGLKKNLILMDEFKLNNMYDQYFYKKDTVEDETNTEESGADESGTDESNTDESGTEEAGADEANVDQATDDQG